MIKLVLVCSLVALGASGQQRSGSSSLFLQKVPGATFDKCLDAEAAAKELFKDIPDRIYVMELYPSERYSLFYPFPSETSHLPQALTWLSSYREQALAPRAILYFIDGRYTFRCRDNQGHFVETSGPSGDPLQLKINAGKAEIWHFSRTPQGLTRVFIVADKALDELDGEDLMAQIKQQLKTHFSFVFVRNDPWFLGDSPDAAPYIFAGDKFKTITEQEYRQSKTMWCRTDIGCKVWRYKE